MTSNTQLLQAFKTYLEAHQQLSQLWGNSPHTGKFFKLYPFDKPFHELFNDVDIWVKDAIEKLGRDIERHEDDDSFVKTVELGVNTGGHVYNDIITLKNGMVIRISEDLICIYASEEDDEQGNYIVFTENKEP